MLFNQSYSRFYYVGPVKEWLNYLFSFIWNDRYVKLLRKNNIFIIFTCFKTVIHNPVCTHGGTLIYELFKTTKSLNTKK